MIILNHAPAETITRYGADLLNTYRMSLGSFEEAAQACTEKLYHTFTDAQSKPQFALVRIYRLFNVDELMNLQEVVSPEIDQWMVLMGTYGHERAWCDRHQSQGHKALPVTDRRSPMLAAAFKQLGLEESTGNGTGELNLQRASFMTRYFYVAQAKDSPHVPAQSEFVDPYGIQSVIGIGSRFVSHSAYLLLAFSTVPMTQEAAKNFAGLSSYISTLMAIYDERTAYWRTEA